LKQNLIELKLSYQRGLIIVNDAGSGESQIGFASFSRPPAAVSQTTLFTFHRKKQKITAQAAPFTWRPEEEQTTSLSPRALKIINRFAATEKT